MSSLPRLWLKWQIKRRATFLRHLHLNPTPTSPASFSFVSNLSGSITWSKCILAPLPAEHLYPNCSRTVRAWSSQASAWAVKAQLAHKWASYIFGACRPAEFIHLPVAKSKNSILSQVLSKLHVHMGGTGYISCDPLTPLPHQTLLQHFSIEFSFLFSISILSKHDLLSVAPMSCDQVTPSPYQRLLLHWINKTHFCFSTLFTIFLSI